MEVEACFSRRLRSSNAIDSGRSFEETNHPPAVVVNGNSGFESCIPKPISALRFI
jgi:hypothetical protein